MAEATAELALDFECAVLDADLPVFSIKRLEGILVYVRLLSGSLSSPMTNVVVDNSGDLLGRPDKGVFAPTRAQLRVPAGRTYQVVLLASLPTIGTMRQYLRHALWPPAGLDPEARPVALAGLPLHFRATSGRLVSSSSRPSEAMASMPTTRDLWEAESRVVAESRHRAMALFGVWRLYPTVPVIQSLLAARGNEFIETLLEALRDEIEEVRMAAAHALSMLAHRLPVGPFLEAIGDTRPLNFAACEVAAHVFAAHPEEVPVETLVNLYHSMEHSAKRPASRAYHRSDVETAALRAMGRLGARAPVQLLANILEEEHAIYAIDVRRAAAAALGDLGALAPVEALIAGMEDLQPEVAAVAAKALAQHPAEISDALRERARLMSDVTMARQIIYGRVRRTREV